MQPIAITLTTDVTEESGWALGVLSGTLPEAHEGINRRGTPIVTRVRCVFGHTATHGFGGIPWYRTTEIHGRILRPTPLSAEGTDMLALSQNVIQVSSEERRREERRSGRPLRRGGNVTEESGWALGVLSGTLPEAHEGINRRGTPIVTRVRCVFGHTATTELAHFTNIHRCMHASMAGMQGAKQGTQYRGVNKM